MEIYQKYSHLNGLEILNSKPCSTELDEVFKSCSLRFEQRSPPKIKTYLDEILTSKQWVDKIKVGKSRLTINYRKQGIGVCVQIGNVARTYADILKLNHLGNIGNIDVGVIVVPFKEESKALGTNYAYFERLRSEIQLFENEIKTPLVIYGLGN